MTQFILLFRERLRQGAESAYDVNERAIARAAARLHCPHPYLALASVSGSTDVWWLNAFASETERDGVNAAYARNQPLMDAMSPLGALKEQFRESSSGTQAAYRPDLSGGETLRLAGTRVFVVSTIYREGRTSGSVFESPSGDRFVIAAAISRAAAEEMAATFGPGAIVMEVRPEWSFPDNAWIRADPEFWRGA